MSKNQKRKLSEKEAKAALYEAGILKWKLKGKQKEVYDFFKGANKDILSCLISRRFGKSFILCILAIEECLNNPTAVVKYICPKQKMVKRIINPIIKLIIEDCPQNLKPEWSPSEGVWKFPKGGEIQIAGSDNGHYDSIRGGYSNLNLVDEAGFCDDLETVVYNVLAPTTDTTGGKTLLASTPNDKDANHEFHTHFVEPGREDNSILEFNIYDSPMLSEKQIAKIIARYPGGVNNPKFRCEYLCEIPRVTESSIIPEFNEDTKSKFIIDDFELPPYCDFYVGMDIGFRDLTIAIFCYYDFKTATLYVLDELVMSGSELTTEALSHKIKLKEVDHFTRPGDYDKTDPFMRVMDIDLRLQNDLQRMHDLLFTCTSKDNLKLMVNNLRIWFSSNRIKIHKKCSNLIYHLANGQWTKQGNEFGRLRGSSSDNGMLSPSHCDGIAALMYLVRNVNEYHNPYPDGFDMLSGPSIFAGSRSNKKSNSGMAEFAKSLTRFIRKDK